MVYQISTGQTIAGRLIKVPQVFIPSIIRTVIVAVTGHETQMLHTIHTYNAGFAVSQADCHAVNLVIQSWVNADYAALCPTTLRFVAIHSRGMASLIEAQDTLSLTGVTGHDSFETLPYEVSLPVAFNTGLTSRAKRGMFYTYAPTEQVNDGTGSPLDTYVIQVVNALTTLIGALTTDAHPLVVASFKHQTFQPVVSAVALPKWGSVVSRKVGRGR